MGKESCENEGQEVGRRRRTYVNNVNALGNGNQHVNKLNELDELNKGNNKITEHRAILLKSQQTNKISQQPENWENCNGPDLVQAFPKKWWVESDFMVPNFPLPLWLKGSGCHYNSINVFNNTGTN